MVICDQDVFRYPSKIAELQTTVELMKVELKTARKLEKGSLQRIKSLESERDVLLRLLLQAMKNSEIHSRLIAGVAKDSMKHLSNETLRFQALIQDLATRFSGVASELLALSQKVRFEDALPSENDIQEVKDILHDIYEKEPGVSYSLQSFLTGIASSMWATVLMEFIRNI
jgi:hypothetical protein